MRTKSTVTSIRSPFGDSNEVLGDDRRKDGGINVHKTVEVSRAGSVDSSLGSGEVTPWPRNMKEDGDMV